jgi:hypothetical protein
MRQTEKDWLNETIAALDLSAKVVKSFAENSTDQVIRAGFEGIAGGYIAALAELRARRDAIMEE